MFVDHLRPLLLAFLLPVSQVAADPDLALMPRPEDYTSMWWAGGFPTVVPGAPWERCIQTGHYAMVLDTEAMTIPHLGAVPAGISYIDCNAGDTAAWRDLPAAELQLMIAVNGQRYQCTGAEPWGRFSGPRTIESGRFLQRADVTDLVFESKDGDRLNVEARFESVAWSDRLGLILAAGPGLQSIRAGEESFGRSGGGYGLDGGNELVISHGLALDPERFSLGLWVYVPIDYRVSARTWPWLVCKNRNEHADGNFGIMLVDGRAEARMNIGGGAKNMFSVVGKRLRLGGWNHLAMTYDGDWLRLFLNGQQAGEEKVGRRRKPGRDALVFGRRGDGGGDGYRFRGVIDEIRLVDRALDAQQIQQWFREPNGGIQPTHEWSFQADGEALETIPRERWENPMLEVAVSRGGRRLGQRQHGVEATLMIDPARFEVIAATDPPVVVAADGNVIDLDQSRGWYRINLDSLVPTLPDGDPGRRNDAIETIRLSLSNPGEREQIARLMFEKTARGFRQRIGSPITGVTAILRDSGGVPAGIPVQLSKNWHQAPEGGSYAGTWFHGISQLRLPAKSSVELELVMANGHWGGVPAASHAQLSLIGWGTNQRWDQSALGAWGESFCYEPDQIQGKCSITDVRPLMVRPMNGAKQWSWTNNVGGGDFFRSFDAGGARESHRAMRASYLRYGPCLTEVIYSGRIGDWARHSEVVSLARTDDIVRACYRLRLDVERDTDLSRFVIFQVGADTYNQTREAKLAIGNESGLINEWESHAGLAGYQGAARECRGRVPWISMHEGAPFRERERRGAWANRGIVIRSWQARLGGEEASPWIAEHGVNSRGGATSTIDIVPPPGVTQLQAGDFVEAVLEYVVVPQAAGDYYGPNPALRSSLEADGNTWRMIRREALGNDRRIDVRRGTLEATYPDVRIRADGGKATIALEGGVGHIPITITGLGTYRGFELRIDGKVLDQSVHGNDFWQCDFDADARSWSLCYNLPSGGNESRLIEFAPRP